MMWLLQAIFSAAIFGFLYRKLFPKSVLKAYKLTLTAKLPFRVHPKDAGLDLFSDEITTVPPRSRKLIKTGLCVSIPEGCYGRIASRSGLATKQVDVGAGVVDENYRGEISVLLINSGTEEFPITRETRIAQLVCEKLSYPEIVQVYSKEDLTVTDRGSAGFGSSG